MTFYMNWILGANKEQNGKSRPEGGFFKFLAL